MDKNKKNLDVREKEMQLQEKYKLLKKQIQEYESLCVAFSGGVDSTFLLFVAYNVLGNRTMAITVRSSMYPKRELKEAEEFAKNLGVHHLCIDANEYSIPEFVQNDKERCYYCKKAIFTKIQESAKKFGINQVADGSNGDDTFDYRPGMRAIKELQVVSPLKEAGLTKEEIRILSKEEGLPTWDKPSMACLASRIPYGMAITPEQLLQVEKGENYLLQQGFTQFRVRHHGNLARIEVSPHEQEKFFQPDFVQELVAYFKKIGYLYVTLDLQGYRTGSMNEVL